MRWGLVPHFAQDLRDFRMNTINAKAETLMTSAMWRLPFTRRRCLVPADGFYEWKKIDERTKQPYAFAMKSGEPHTPKLRMRSPVVFVQAEPPGIWVGVQEGRNFF
jgi:putative SOS response-associated peptidase YedK